MRSSKAYTYYEQAQTLLNMGGMDNPVLMSVRNSLEALVKEYSEKCGLDYDTRTTDLEQMINRLHETCLISSDVLDLMHRTRILGNKGSHVDSSTSPYDAQEAFSNMTEILKVMEKSYDEQLIQDINLLNNLPMKNPDYYSVNRRYYGKWSRCMSRNSLLVIPEYIELEARALSGDVAACLDIACGFLPIHGDIPWNSNGLINMPSSMYRGEELSQENAYDIRYYYWIMRAVIAAGDCIMSGRSFSMKYIATAIWEAHLLWFYLNVSPVANYYITGISESIDSYSGKTYLSYEYGDQYLLAAEMFGCSLETLNDTLSNFILYDGIHELTESVFNQRSEPGIVSAIYREASDNPQFKLRLLTYLVRANCNHSCSQKDDRFALSYRDELYINNDLDMLRAAAPGAGITGARVAAGDIFSFDMLEPYRIGSFGNKYFCQAREYSIADSRRTEVEKIDRSALYTIKTLFDKAGPQVKNKLGFLH